jgi:hypothetical protein
MELREEKDITMVIINNYGRFFIRLLLCVEMSRCRVVVWALKDVLHLDKTNVER